MTTQWWRDAVVYEIYVRSFADGNADGIGDLPGITERLGYLADLGIDAIWLTPFYRSPMADGGYDVADYRDVDPMFGTLADFDRLLDRAHRLGIRVIIDIVPNHSSTQHPWFTEALAAPGSDARQRYVFRDGAGPDGAQPPNNWTSMFGGAAWTRVPDGQWYLHLFAPEQPDFNWHHPQVHAEFVDVLRFWLRRGVDGFRIDVAMGMYKADGLPDLRAGDEGFSPTSPMWGRPQVHEVFRSWRRVLDSYSDGASGDRIAIGEVWTHSAADLAHYVRPDELHQSFNFAWLLAPWSAEAFRAVIDETLATVGSPSWVASNHDVVRHITRYADDGDLAVGRARGNAALLMMLALPGSTYLYQGEELGLAEVDDLPDGLRQDPTFARTGGAAHGRDGCRVPLPWSGTGAPFGFGEDGTVPWLPQPDEWAGLTVARQHDDPHSTLWFYRNALRIRRALRDELPGTVDWLDADPGVLSFRRGPLVCVCNCGDAATGLPEHEEVLLASVPPEADRLAPNAAAWLRVAPR